MAAKNCGVGELKKGARIVENKMLGIKMFWGFFVCLVGSGGKMVINLTHNTDFLPQAKKHKMRYTAEPCISFIAQSNNVIQSENQRHHYLRSPFLALSSSTALKLVFIYTKQTLRLYFLKWTLIGGTLIGAFACTFLE